MKSIETFIADITSSNYFKDNPQIVDKLAIYRWVDLALKSFGRDLMDKKQKVVEVRNYRAYLGKEFGYLVLGAFCEKDKVIVKGDSDEYKGNYLYIERVEKTDFYNKVDNCTTELTCSEEKTISEKIYVQGTELDFRYKNIQYVKLGRDVLYDNCEDCISNRDSPYSINVKGKELHASFKEGDLYIEYYALPYTEDGEILIPETPRGFLEQYLEVLVKRKLLEDAIMAKDSANLISMYSNYAGQERELFAKAKNDLSPVNIQSFWKLIAEKRKYGNKFSINLGRTNG